VFDRMLHRWPTDAYALSSRSFVRAQTGRGDAAIDDAQRLVDTNPAPSAGDWFNLGFLLGAASRNEEAVAAFEKALALDPKFDRAWYGMGLALQRLGRHEDALAALKRNTELQPMSPYGWYHLARVHADCEHPDEARRIIRHLRGFEPRIADQLERETGLLAS
jgi:tetratricopeptide (TPR) repeat protein